MKTPDDQSSFSQVLDATATLLKALMASKPYKHLEQNGYMDQHDLCLGDALSAVQEVASEWERFEKDELNPF